MMRSAGIHLNIIHVILIKAKLLSWVANSTWLGNEEGFSTLYFCTASSTGGPQPKAKGLLWGISLTKTPYWLWISPLSVSAVMKKPAFCWENLIQSSNKAIAAGRSLCFSTHVATKSSWSWGAYICSIFLYRLAPCNAKRKKIPEHFSDRELQEEFTAQQPKSARPPSLPATLLLSSLWDAAALCRISGDCEKTWQRRGNKWDISISGIAH